MESLFENLVIYNISDSAEIYSSVGTRRDMINRKSFGLIFSTVGKINYFHSDTVYSTDRDHFIFAPQGSTYYLVCESEDVSPVINFDCNLQTDRFFRFDIPDKNTLDDAKTIVKLYLQKNTGWQLQAKALLYKIIGSLFDSISSGYFPPHINACVSYIYKNFGDPELDNKEIADSANISQIYLQKEFVKYIGQPPRKFLQKIRINTAAEMLMSKNLSVSDIAQSVGYASVYHFSRAFKNMTGISPLQYRKNSRQKM